MYVRTKSGGSPASPHEYLQVVEGYRENGRVKQRVIANLGRLDELVQGGTLDGLIVSLSRFSEHLKVLDLTRTPDVNQCQTKAWGPYLVFRRLWEEQGLPQIITRLAVGRRFRFDLERVCFALVLQRLIRPGSDLRGSNWLEKVRGLEGIKLQHLYRACRFLAQEQVTIETELFERERTLFDTTVDLVFFDTTSTYFEGHGSQLRQYGYSKDHRPDRVQIVVGVVMSRAGWPLACEFYPGNQADVKTMGSLIRLIQERLKLGRVVLAADRGFVSRDNLIALAASGVDYIVGVRMRQVKEVREEVLNQVGDYQVVSEDLQIKEVWVKDRRYVVCLNPDAAIRDAEERKTILEKLKQELTERGAKSLIGNQGYAQFLRAESGAVRIDPAAVADDERFDGKYVLETNTALNIGEVAQAYKSLWQVERAFREMKSTLEVRPVFHQSDSNVKGHIFGTFLALRLEIALQKKLAKAGFKLPWERLMENLEAVRAVEIVLFGKAYEVRTDLEGDAYKVLQAVGIRPPPRVRILSEPTRRCAISPSEA